MKGEQLQWREKQTPGKKTPHPSKIHRDFVERERLLEREREGLQREGGRE